METTSFAALKLQLTDTCAFLESFGLGRAGFTQQDVLAGICRVKSQCERLKEFSTGPHAREAETIEIAAKTHIATAETRIALLRERQR
jgi:hypothetical protein